MPFYASGYNQIAFKDFSGGLNLRDKSDAVGEKEAIDLLNVTFTERGAVRQRDGYDDLTPADLTNRVDSLSPFYKTDGTRQLVAGCGTRLEALNVAGAVVQSLAGLAGGPWQFLRFGAPGTETLYAANGADTPRKWDGTTWTAPTATVNGVAGGAMPRAGALAITASVPGQTSGSNATNRMLATAFGTQSSAGPGGFATNPLRWFISNPGQPEVFETDGSVSPIRGKNFGDLTPGDGEQIMAAVTWRELIFIFKESKFFVLWGESANTDGTPIMNFREVVNSIGLASKMAVAVGRDGVYFFNRMGVYRTTGGNPELISDIIRPLWTGDPEVYYRGSPINLNQLGLVRMAWHAEQIFVAIPTGSSAFNDRLLVYDVGHQWWTVYDIAASALAGFRRADRNELHHGYATGPPRVGHRSYGADLDRGAPMVSRWRSGWTDYGASQQTTVRETRVWGSGAVNVDFSVDFFRDARGSQQALFGARGSSWTYDRLTQRGGTYAQLTNAYTTYATLATNTSLAPTVEQSLIRYAVRGTVFSTQFANNPAEKSWSVHRVARHVREIREPSVS
jgi:hypothetical protein